jgi:hypothetical protein
MADAAMTVFDAKYAYAYGYWICSSCTSKTSVPNGGC